MASAATGSLISVLALMGILEKKIEAQIEDKHTHALEYVDRKYDNVQSDINVIKTELIFIKNMQAETNSHLRVMSDRIFEMNKMKRD